MRCSKTEAQVLDVSDSQSNLFSVHVMEMNKSILPKLQFKTLTEQLADDEFDELLSKFRIQIGREEMLKLIVDGSCDSQLNALKGEILPIMQHRKPNNEDADSPTLTVSNNHAITTLPTAMIGEIASYLDQKSYARFSTINRKMFVNCNSPNRLVTLDLSGVVDFNFISLMNYRHLTSLDFHVADINDFDFRLISRCHRLQTLMIGGSDLCGTEKLLRFLTDIDGPLTGVTSLALYRFDEDNDGVPLPSELLPQLLALFPALTYLKLFSLEFTGHLDTALIAGCCPFLQRLHVCDVHEQLSFLNAYGQRITELGLCSYFEHFAPPNLDYSKVRRLYLNAPSQNTVNGFLKTSKNLEKICFVPGPDGDQPTSDSEIKRMIKKFIVDLKSLRFFHVSTPRHFENICNSIYQGLFCTKTRDREFMEIGLTVDCREITDFDDFMCSISRIMVGLNQSATEKWILSLHANRHRSFEMVKESMEPAVSAFMTSFKTMNVEILLSGEWKYVFGSRGSSFMDAHRDWWNDFWKIDFD